MFKLFGDKTAKSVQQSGRRFRVRLPKKLIGETYRTARAVQTEDEITQRYDAREFAAILAETLPPAGAP